MGLPCRLSTRPFMPCQTDGVAEGRGKKAANHAAQRGFTPTRAGAATAGLTNKGPFICAFETMWATWSYPAFRRTARLTKIQKRFRCRALDRAGRFNMDRGQVDAGRHSSKAHKWGPAPLGAAEGITRPRRRYLFFF